MLPLLNLIRSPTVVFRFFDHLDQFERMPHSIFELVRAFSYKADLCLASSRDVQEKLCRKGLEALYLPNGTRSDAIPVESALNDCREPRAVYIGAIDHWFDFDAMEYWAARIPEVEFEVIGPNRIGYRSSLPNLSFLGPRPYEEAINHLLGAQFGLIPFKLDGLTSGVHPIKLYDYLGAGCEVISVDLPEVPDNQEGVFKYQRPEQAVAILQNRTDRVVNRIGLRRYAEQNTWRARLDSVCEILCMDI